MFQPTERPTQHPGVTVLAAAVALLVCLIAGGASFDVTSTLLAPDAPPANAVLPAPTPGPTPITSLA